MEDMATYLKSRLLSGQSSLLSKIQGIYKFSLDGRREINLIVMNNIGQMLEESHKITYRFDIKGSRINRWSLDK